MGKVKQWLMEMEEDAVDMTRDEFIDRHGEYQVDVWDTVNSVDPDSFMQIKHGMDCYTDNCIMDVLPDIEEEESVF